MLEKERVCELIIVVIVVASLVTGSAGVAASSDTTASEALAVEEEAESLYQDLVTIQETRGVDVSDSALTSIENNLDRGAVEFESGNYDAAKAEFEKASDQAKGELETVYTEAAIVSLDTAEQRVGDVTDQGYVTAETAELETQISHVRQQTGEASSFDEASQAYEDAVSLEEQAQSLPNETHVSVAQFLTAYWVHLIVGSALLVVVIGGGVYTLYTRFGGSPNRPATH